MVAAKPDLAIAPGQTDSLVSFVHAVRWEALADDVRHAARRHLLDTIGVIVSGCSGDVAARLEEVLSRVRPGGTVPVPGRARRADMLDAARIAGTGGHGIELDDGYRQGSVHPGVAVVPAVMAMAHGRGASGKAVLEAVVAGYETVIAVARAAHPDLRNRGFHPTGTVGALGAAAATARLVALEPERIANALGLAASSASGLFAFLAGGGDVKRLHAGHAAQEGLVATLLAQQGVAGPPDVIEGSDGFLQAYAFGRGGRARAIAVPPEVPYGITDCYIKPYACCRHLQPAVEALMALRAEHGLDETNVRAIKVETYRIAAEHAHTGWGDFASAQLSFPFIMALGLRHGAIGLEHFEAAVREDPGIARICAMVEVSAPEEVDRLYPERRPARVTLDTDRGLLVREVPEALGSRLVPFDDDQLREKFMTLSVPVLGETRSGRLRDLLWAVEEVADISEVLELTVPAAEG